MAKGKKPTTQELYEARKKREEEEKVAFLPPGLINHGNTCFMNSVLQGLIATPLLYDLVHFQPIPPSIQDGTVTSPILASRSPQLTNGHGLGGEYEKEWVEGMALGDVFVRVMEKAWHIQNDRRREHMSPKELLSAIGRKYDQYLDFRQQDAHEFLSHLLDAMRMEELDIIKQRQPPPPKKKRRRSSKQPFASSSAAGAASPRTAQFQTSLPPLLESSKSSRPSPEAEGDVPAPSPLPSSLEETLATFSDMLFGGKLASFLVCEKCKHISCTYEDFNDLSLSIKPEDYARERKRDKLKTFAKKLRLRPSTAPGVPRSSSVPASPIRRNSDEAAEHEPLVEHQHVRRRSIDATPATEELPGSSLRNLAASSEFEPPATEDGQEGGVDKVSEDKDKDHVEFVVVEKPEKDKKEKEDNDWVKLGRRISMSVAMGMGKKDRERRSRSMERVRSTESERGKSKNKDGEDIASSPAPSVQHFSPPSPAIPIKNREPPSRTASPSPNFSASPLVSGSPLMPIIRRAGSPSLMGGKQVKTPRPPKLSREESAYLRRLLADVQLPTSSHPLALFRPPSFTGSHPTHHPHSSASATSTAAQSLWAKLGQIPSIEECLRLFTSVEVLEGENMVGCRRCWKIANGTYQKRPKSEKNRERAGIDVEDSETSEESVRRAERGASRSPSASPAVQARSLPASIRDASPGRDLRSEPLASAPDLQAEVVSPASSTASLSAQSARSSLLPAQAEAGTSVSSVAATVASYLPSALRLEAAPLDSSQASPSPEVIPEYRGFPVPSISTTAAPESPSATKPLPSLPVDSMGASTSRSSLSAPPVRYGRGKQERKGDESESEVESESEGSGAESDASGFSDGSAYASPGVSQENLARGVGLGLNLDEGARRKTPRSKQVVFRRAYKRYLIATAPPVLIIHLKRFQQISKSPALSSFSSGFRKLDEFVAFPEYLDLGPYLAPNKEEFGLGSEGGEEKARQRRQGKCMYRLYAVVVHIGNMLGGHYVAYTALPDARSPVSQQSDAAGSDGAQQERSHAATRQWAYISDTVVRLTTLEEVLKAKAYLCMYERI
ncbi:peptidase C19, ubiquitin carboxyl-terminal hydrolase 2 [Heliocybe sulcata]|uniref:ubiquitinyl hydrolase 1 n=1 Tax=Heliocybe sulcata TaxID=5364 RepID=A0A5C3MW71_9AGAM|nr:peptidase C19, ubiquitin carboxyl-terminal hydrolase 2 [Heliocybe sulcata]